MQPTHTEQLVCLLLIAGLVSILAQKLRLPLSVGLLVSGFAIALLSHHSLQIGLTPEILFFILLPPLIFESGLNLKWAELKADAAPLMLLVTLGIAINMGITASGLHYLGGWDWLSSLFFGAATSATDPIAVIATFKDSGLVGRPRLLAEAESVLNDGVAVIAFTMVALVASGVTESQIGLDLIKNGALSIIGGVATGLVVGFVLLRAIGHSKDPLAETTLTAVAAYGAYFIADHIHGSGILATATAGVMIGNVSLSSRDMITMQGRETVERVWEFAAFLANALVFILLGVSLSQYQFGPRLTEGLFAVIIAVVGRAASVYISCGLLAKSRYCVPMAIQHLLVWGGQRGALSLILVIIASRMVKNSEELLICGAILVVFSILVQGMSFKPALARLLTKIGSDSGQ